MTKTTTASTNENLVVINVSGPDKPGVTATITSIIALEGARLIDIGQAVLHNYLSLSAIVEIKPGNDALRKILFAVGNLGLRIEASAFKGLSDESSLQLSTRPALCLTLLGMLEDGHAIAGLARFVAEREMNIREIKTLSGREFRGLELNVSLAPFEENTEQALQILRGEILSLSTKLGVDMAVQKDDLHRRNKRLVCFDVDSTFVQMEVIDELARLAGCMDKVAAITERAMQGELDFKSALSERVKCLKGLRFEDAKKLLENIPLTPGADRLVRALRVIGARIGLVSGGFDFFVNELKDRYKLDFAFANQLEVVDGKLTGRVMGAIVDAERKAQILHDMANAYSIRLEQSAAVGDGANDIQMLKAAGLGIAFRAKPKLQSVADLSLNQGGLDSILYLMGYRASDIQLIT